MREIIVNTGVLSMIIMDAQWDSFRWKRAQKRGPFSEEFSERIELQWRFIHLQMVHYG